MSKFIRINIKSKLKLNIKERSLKSFIKYLQVWEGLDSVKTGRKMLGETNPKDSAPGTIRGDFCIQVGRNIIHGSDSVESAKNEISLWFPEEKKEGVIDWASWAEKWIYE